VRAVEAAKASGMVNGARTEMMTRVAARAVVALRREGKGVGSSLSCFLSTAPPRNTI
jgi:hypothetical protein